MDTIEGPSIDRNQNFQSSTSTQNDSTTTTAPLYITNKPEMPRERRERLEEFKGSLRENIAGEKKRQRQKMEKLKEKYDKEGVEVLEDVS